MSIQLNFINRSNDTNNSQVVIFQKNASDNVDEVPVAWKVIENCGPSDNHAFTFPASLEIAAIDSWGNSTPRRDAQHGQQYQLTGSGGSLLVDGPAPSGKEVHLRNDLTMGAIAAGVYKDSRLLALKNNVAPGQKAVFEFKPTIWIGVASEAIQGAPLNSAILSDVNTELSLQDIVSADIVMYGGGLGRNSTAFQFTLENIVKG